MTAELCGTFGPAVIFVAETGLRPSEWIALERRAMAKTEAIVLVQRTFAGGSLCEYGKTDGSRRRVPLTQRALDAFDTLPPRLDTPLLFPSARGTYLNLDDWRRDDWHPALDAAGIDKGGGTCGLYRLRHTYTADALAAGIGPFEVARFMGTSMKEFDDTYGHLIAGAEDIAKEKLDALDERMGQERATAEEVQNQ